MWFSVTKAGFTLRPGGVGQRNIDALCDPLTQGGIDLSKQGGLSLLYGLGNDPAQMSNDIAN
jgi:hypothetical protein